MTCAMTPMVPQRTCQSIFEGPGHCEFHGCHAELAQPRGPVPSTRSRGLRTTLPPIRSLSLSLSESPDQQPSCCRPSLGARASPFVCDRVTSTQPRGAHGRARRNCPFLPTPVTERFDDLRVPTTRSRQPFPCVGGRPGRHPSVRLCAAAFRPISGTYLIGRRLSSCAASSVLKSFPTTISSHSQTVRTVPSQTDFQPFRLLDSRQLRSTNGRPERTLSVNASSHGPRNREGGRREAVRARSVSCAGDTIAPRGQPSSHPSAAPGSTEGSDPAELSVLDLERCVGGTPSKRIMGTPHYKAPRFYRGEVAERGGSGWLAWDHMLHSTEVPFFPPVRLRHNQRLLLTSPDAAQSVLRPLCLLSGLAAEAHVRPSTKNAASRECDDVKTNRLSGNGR